MRTDVVTIIGAGGHARVVVDALLASGLESSQIAVRDARSGLDLLGIQVMTPEIEPGLSGKQFHVAVGGPVRESLHAAALTVGGRPMRVVHPAAVVSQYATLADGVFAAAAAVIAPAAIVGEGTIINHGAVVDHDVVIGDFSHIAPNATLGGGVQVGSRATIGAGAVVLPGRKVGDGATVGASAVLLDDAEAGQIWVGNPARRVKR